MTTGPVLDHVGILVIDLAAAISRYEQILGTRFEQYPDDAPLDCTWARTPVGDGTTVELVSPRSPTSPYARDLDRRGEGLHHVSFRVDDIGSERERLAAVGLGVVGFTLDHAGWQEFFVHPRDAHGTLVHFSVPPEEYR